VRRQGLFHGLGFSPRILLESFLAQALSWNLASALRAFGAGDQIGEKLPTQPSGAAMLTRIACSFAGAMCATAFGLMPALGLAQTAAPTVDPSPGPARNHRWAAPDFSDIDIANSPERLIAIPATARRGRAVFDGTQVIKLNGREEMLAPGGRIIGADNMVKLSGSLLGRARVKFIRETTTGLLMQVWILTPKEIETPDPKPFGSTD
jgi:hypothetical protein